MGELAAQDSAASSPISYITDFSVQIETLIKNKKWREALEIVLPFVVRKRIPTFKEFTRPLTGKEKEALEEFVLRLHHSKGPAKEKIPSQRNKEDYLRSIALGKFFQILYNAELRQIPKLRKIFFGYPARQQELNVRLE